MSTFPKLTAAYEKRRALSADLKAIFDEAGPDVDLSQVKSIPGGPDQVLNVIRQKNTALEEVGGEIAQLEELRATIERAGQSSIIDAVGDPESGPTGQPKSLGRMFVESAAYRQRHQRVTADLGVDVRNAVFSTTAGWAPESTRTGIISTFPTRPAPHVVDFIPTLPTEQAAIKYMEETTFTNAAAERAEAAAYAEAAIVLTERSQIVESVGVFLPVTDEQLEDEDQAAAYLDQRLGFMLQQRLDLQVLLGTGVTPLLKGTNAVTGIQTQALGTDSIPDAVYKMFTSIRSDGFAEPSVLFIRPSHWQTVRLAKTADGQYIWGPPSMPGPFTVWGTPVVETTVLTGTEAYAGDYATHASLYVRRAVEVQVTNAHSDFFANGKQAIRAGLRVAMVHYRPKAFGEVTGLTA